MTDILARVTFRPGDAGYDEAATVYVRTGRPALAVRPRTPHEVAAAVRRAAACELELSVKSGGHSALGFGTNDGGMVIDLGGFDSVEVLDPDGGRVRIGAGARWGDVAGILGRHGLALSSGDTTSVGVGGLTTGGGIGWMVRRHGLTIDSLEAAEIVTADGSILRISESEHADLFWAVRGGGGNFGILTRLEFRAQRHTTVHAGVIGYALDDVPALLKGWAEVHRTGPEELNSTLVLMPAFGEGMPPAGAMGLVCYAGSDSAAAEAAFAPLLSLGTVVMSDISEKPYADVLQEAHPPPGLRAVADNTLVEAVNGEVVDAIAEYFADGTAGRMGFVRALGGAAARVSTDATAYAHRNVEAMVVGGAFRPEPATDEEMTAALAPFEPVRALGVGAYSGFVATDRADNLSRVYPPATLSRLRGIKRAHDPENLFRRNLNIAP